MKISPKLFRIKGRAAFYALVLNAAVGIALGSFGAASARADTRYVSQNGGTFSGGAACNGNPVISASAFNSTTNSPGDIDYLCGTITTPLVVMGNGSNGNPVSIVFDSGAALSEPFCPTTGCLNISGGSYITIDGGSNGIIEATANGSSLSNKQKGSGIYALPCNNCEIRNLTIANIYVHVPNESSIDQTQVDCVYFAGSNWLIHDNVMHDAGWCLMNTFRNGDTNVRIYNNNIYNVDHGYAPNGYGSLSASNFYFYNNHVHDFAVWDTGAVDSYHHDGVHAYGTGGASLANLQIYNNTFDGNPGTNFTSFVRFEKPDGSASLVNPLMFNNVLNGAAQPADNFGLFSGDSYAGGQEYNNTFIARGGSSSYCMIVNGGTGAIENNIFQGCGNAITDYSAGIGGLTINYNTYSGVSCLGSLINGATCFSTLASWRAYTGQDAVSQLISSVGLLASSVPVVGSAVLGKGVNLTNLGIVALDSDRNDAIRPSSGAWDAGAYELGSTASRPLPPTGLTITIQ